VDVTFANGTKDTASFVVGCDGLHSNTRIALFGKEKADFTGMVRVSPFQDGPGVEADIRVICRSVGCLLRHLPFKGALHW
jgi:2-polyprenyl-6-methoxyphenol hydroxylase-like FAD-dependent oxidoreductase